MKRYSDLIIQHSEVFFQHLPKQKRHACLNIAQKLYHSQTPTLAASSAASFVTHLKLHHSQTSRDSSTPFKTRRGWRKRGKLLQHPHKKAWHTRLKSGSSLRNGKSRFILPLRIEFDDAASNSHICKAVKS